ncbi:MAG: protein-glutamate O-methyltransferase CheR [Oscillospiraceae bacterium]|nr:protein-glutamate O-methyltransferase CheR [Oscillospiraceae bacterium]
MIHLTDAEFQIIYPHIRERYGLNLEKKKYLIESKLWIELARYRVGSYTEYWQMLRADATGTMERRMLDLLTTHYTYFCRESQHFDFLKDRILPQLGRARTAPLHIWCAGCATGQECYTLAMLLLDCQTAGTLRVPFHIFGADLSDTAIAAARKGAYGSADYARLPRAWQCHYATPFQNGEFQVLPQIKALVTFRQQNLLDRPALPERFDVIFCRNVLIYFSEKERAQLLGRLTQVLRPGGYLLIGHTESLIGIQTALTYVQPAVYRKPGGAAA